MKRIIIALISSTIIMGFFHVLSSFIMGGIATVRGVPIPYYKHTYMTGEVFFSIWILILDFIIWFVIILGIIHLTKKKN